MQNKKYSLLNAGTLYHLLVSLVFLASAVVILVLVNYHIKRQALMEAEAKSLLLLDRNLAIHKYFANYLKPTLFEFTKPIRSKDYFDPRWMSSTFAIREIDKYTGKTDKDTYYYKECAINARSPENEADAYESAFLNELNKNPGLQTRSEGLKTRSEVRIIDNKPYFVVMHRGEVMDEACILCHGDPQNAPAGLVRLYGPKRSFGRKAGGVVSAISIRIPLSKAYSQANNLIKTLSCLLVAILAGMFIFKYLLSKHLILKPLKKIKDKVLQISLAPEHLGETIPLPYGREFEEMTESFNRMSLTLRHNAEIIQTDIKKSRLMEQQLLKSKEELELKVTGRTSELSLTNEQLKVSAKDREMLLDKLKDLNATLEERVVEETNRRMMQEQMLIQQSKLASMGEMIGAIAHQWRQPLNAVSLIIGDLTDAFDFGELDRNYLSDSVEKTLEQIKHMSNTIEDFRNFFKPGKAKAPFKINTAVKEVLYLVHDQLLKAHIGISLDYKYDAVRKPGEGKFAGICTCEPEITVYGYPNEFKQTILNLLGNARDAIVRKRQQSALPEGESGEIIVELSRTSRQAILEIKDNGGGISAEIIDKIFEPYFTTKEAEGTGIGLHMAKVIIEQHMGGAIRAANGAKGAVFTIALPVEDGV